MSSRKLKITKVDGKRCILMSSEWVSRLSYLIVLYSVWMIELRDAVWNLESYISFLSSFIPNVAARSVHVPSNGMRL